MSHYLLLMSLGPVQDFIASARKCRDLWYGSWLLSELSKATAQGVVDAAGVANPDDCLIFPGATVKASIQGPNSSVANRILARLEGDADKIRHVAEAAERAMLDRLAQLRDEAFGRIGKGDPDRNRHFHEDAARQQVDSMMELMWVAVEETNGYAAARNDAERLMAARKNTRVWTQPPWAQAAVPKSSLDGARESVLDESIFDKKVVPDKKHQPSLSPLDRRRWYGVHGAERLCGPGILKRFGRAPAPDSANEGNQDRFMSTSHLAALPWMVGVERSDVTTRQKVEQYWDAIKTHLDALGIEGEFRTGVRARRSFFDNSDGAMLFWGRLMDEISADPSSSAVVELRRELNDILHAAGRGEPIPYYAILVADGDSMGKLIDAQNQFTDHRQLSISLRAFAAQARDIVLGHEGSPIYAGGDDVMALLPLHTALDCANDLQSAFKKHLKGWKHADGSASMSAGLAVVHHLMPLSQALKLARDAEHEAKENAGRNALCVIVDKRGGTPVTIHQKWSVLVPLLDSLIQLRRSDELSDRAGHELAALQRLTQFEGKDDKNVRNKLREAQVYESLRVIYRKRAQHGAKDTSDATKDRLRQLIEMDTISPDMLGRALYVAGLLTKAIQQGAPNDPSADQVPATAQPQEVSA